MSGRVKKACTFCKRRKIKCDGNTPCSNCLKYHIQCGFGQTYYKEDKNTTMDYIKHLENKIKQLEQKPIKLEDDAFGINHFSNRGARFGITRRYHSILPQELANSMVQALDQKEREEMPIPRNQYYGWNMSGGHYLEPRQLPDVQNIDSELTDYLLQYYFTNINPLYSIIHERLFQEQLTLYNSNHDKTSKLFGSILNLILAISMRFVESDPLVTYEIKHQIIDLEEQLFANGYEIVSILSFEWQSFELIQCWILITFYLRTTHRQTSSFAALGTATRMCKGMGLQINQTIRNYKDKPLEMLKIKRILWLVYTWDRLYSFQHGDHIEIPDSLISVEFPSLEIEDDWLHPQALAMIYMAKYAGEIIENTMNSPIRDYEFVEKITKDLLVIESWCESNLKGDSLINDQVYLTLNDILLSLYNRFIFELLGKEKFPLTNIKSSSILIDRSFKTIEIFNKLDQSNKIQIPWFLNLNLLFNISVISIGFINTGIHFEICSSNLQTCLNLLVKLESHSKMSKECVWTIKLLNHICVSKSIKTLQTLSIVGIDHGPKDINNSNFLQFEYVEPKDDDLNWFDQWIDL